MSLVRLLKDQPRYFNDIQKATGLSPRIVDKHLSLLVKDGLVMRTHMGRKTLYSLTEAGISFSKNVPFSLIWDLFDFQRDMALYAHLDVPRYSEYGMKIDFALMPNDGFGFELPIEALEESFMKGLVGVIKSGKSVPEVKNGKLLVAFQVDWPTFSNKMKETNNRLVQPTFTKEQKKESKAIKRLKEGEVLNSKTGGVFDRKTRKLLYSTK